MLLYVTIRKSQLIQSNGCRLRQLICVCVCVCNFFWCFGRLHSKSFNLNAHVNKTSAFILDISGSQHDKCIACMYVCMYVCSCVAYGTAIAIIHTNRIHKLVFSTNLNPNSPKHDQTLYKRMNVVDKKTFFFLFVTNFYTWYTILYEWGGKKKEKNCMLRAIKHDVSSLYNNNNNIKATTSTRKKTK